MTDEQILALRPGDPLVAYDLCTIPDAEGGPLALDVVKTTGSWTLAAINHLRARIGAPPLPDEDDDDG